VHDPVQNPLIISQMRDCYSGNRLAL